MSLRWLLSSGELRYLRVRVSDPGSGIPGTGIQHFTFTRDGRRIAVGLSSGKLPKSASVSVLDTSSGAEIMSDRISPDHPEDDRIVGLAFERDGGLIAASYFGALKRYGSDLRLLAHRDVRRPTAADKYVVDAAVEPSGHRVAVAYTDNTVSILDAQTLKPIAVANMGDVEQVNLRNVTWSGDGATAAAALTTNPFKSGPWYAKNHVLIRRINASGQLYGEDIDVGDVGSGIHSCGDGFVLETRHDDKPLVFVSGLGVLQFVPNNTTK